MIGHLGARVSALLDGQLSPREAEEAWAHVYSCHPCRDLVEREGWIKTRLAGLCAEEGAASSDLKGSLLSLPPPDSCVFGGPAAHALPTDHRRHRAGVAALGGGALGAAMLGVIALGVAPGAAPQIEKRPPVAQIDSPTTSVPSETPVSRLRRAEITSVELAELATTLPMPVRGLLP